jgi:hypothetical protein
MNSLPLQPIAASTTVAQTPQTASNLPNFNVSNTYPAKATPVTALSETQMDRLFRPEQGLQALPISTIMRRG